MRQDRPAAGSQTSLREANRALVVRVVSQRGALTQVELAAATGLSPAAISNIVRELVRSGVVTTSPTSRSGRRALSVALARPRGVLVGLHADERVLRVVLADPAQRVLGECRLPLPPEHGVGDVLGQAGAVLDELLADAAAGREDVRGVGLGIAAPVDRTTGRVAVPRILPGWSDVALPRLFGEALGAPVAVANDADLGALAEVRAGAGRGLRTVAYLRASHGVGLGVVLDGGVLRGRSGAAGEIGHVVVVPDGAPCRCGNVGCLETVVGSNGLLARLRADRGPSSLRDLVAGAVEGDPLCSDLVAEAGDRLGWVVAGVCAVLDPDVVVVGGDLSHAGDVLLDPLREAVRRRTAVGEGGPVPVVLSELGDQAELRGALALAADVAAVVPTSAVL